MTTGNDRRDPNMITFNKDLTYDFIRHFTTNSLAVRKHLETAFECMDDDALLFAFTGMTIAARDDDTSMGDVMKGMMIGVSVAMAASKTGPKTLQDFLDTLHKKGENVADIADAFKKRAEARV